MIGAVGRATIPAFLCRPCATLGRVADPLLAQVSAGRQPSFRCLERTCLADWGDAPGVGRARKACGGMVAAACGTGGRRQKARLDTETAFLLSMSGSCRGGKSYAGIATWLMRRPSQPTQPRHAEGLGRGLAKRWAGSSAVAATARHRKRHRGLAHVKCGFGDRQDSVSSSNTEQMFAGGVRWGASRFPLPARSADGAL